MEIHFNDCGSEYFFENICRNIKGGLKMCAHANVVSTAAMYFCGTLLIRVSIEKVQPGEIRENKIYTKRLKIHTISF